MRTSDSRLLGPVLYNHYQWSDPGVHFTIALLQVCVEYRILDVNTNIPLQSFTPVIEFQYGDNCTVDQLKRGRQQNAFLIRLLSIKNTR